MTGLKDRNRLIVLTAAVAASVFLFACGPSGGQAPRVAEVPPAQTQEEPSEAAVGAAPPPGAEAAPPATPSAAPPAGLPPPEMPSQAAPDAGPAPGAEVPDESAEPEKTYRAPPPAAGNAGRVYSNKDLERYRHLKEEFGMRDNVVVVDLTKKRQGDTVEKTSGMTAADRNAEMEKTRAAITGLMQELDYLKKRVLPLENPFVPRPQVSEADKLAEAGMDNAERLARVKQRMSAIESEVGPLQRRLAELSNMESSDGAHARDGAPDRDER